LRDIWGCRPCPDGKQVNGKRSVKDGLEIYKNALPLLDAYGFYNIFDYRHGLTQSLAGDCIATKAGKNCIIEVTCALSHRIDRHKALANRLGIDLYTLFVKRDGSKCILKKVDVLGTAACVCLSEKKIKACFASKERLLIEEDNKIAPLSLISKEKLI
jgi:hypothetical protein